MSFLDFVILTLSRLLPSGFVKLKKRLDEDTFGNLKTTKGQEEISSVNSKTIKGQE